VKRWIAIAFFVFCACGPSTPPPDEVTESWTAGDDEPLEDEE
jgi:hypothetical protein